MPKGGCGCGGSADSGPAKESRQIIVPQDAYADIPLNGTPPVAPHNRRTAETYAGGNLGTSRSGDAATRDYAMGGSLKTQRVAMHSTSPLETTPVIEPRSHVPSGSVTLADIGLGELVCAGSLVVRDITQLFLAQTDAEDVLPISEEDDEENEWEDTTLVQWLKDRMKLHAGKIIINEPPPDWKGDPDDVEGQFIRWLGGQKRPWKPRFPQPCPSHERLYISVWWEVDTLVGYRSNEAEAKKLGRETLDDIDLEDSIPSEDDAATHAKQKLEDEFDWECDDGCELRVTWVSLGISVWKESRVMKQMNKDTGEVRYEVVIIKRFHVNGVINVDCVEE